MILLDSTAQFLKFFVYRYFQMVLLLFDHSSTVLKSRHGRRYSVCMSIYYVPWDISVSVLPVKTAMYQIIELLHIQSMNRREFGNFPLQAIVSFPLGD